MVAVPIIILVGVVTIFYDTYDIYSKYICR